MKKKTDKQLAEEAGCHPGTIYERRKNGKTGDELTAPPVTPTQAGKKARKKSPWGKLPAVY